MSETVLAALITVGLPMLGAFAAAGWRQMRRRQRRNQQAALKTVETWEQTVDRKNRQIEEWERRYNRLYEDFTRSREIIRDQDARMAQKDNRIAHLELLCDAKGQPS